MSTTRWDDLELLLLAVQRGVLSDAQIEECLRAWEEKRAQRGAGASSLHRVAIEKGFITEERLRELAQVPSPPLKEGSTMIRAQVAMSCPSCKTDFTLSLESALKQPRCKNCSGVLGVKKSSEAPSVRIFAGALPEEVQAASADPQKRFSHYILMDRLGSGGMGEVFRAWDTVMQRTVALKFPRTVGEEEIRRLYAEAQGAGRLSHPNIASVYEVGEVEGRYFIAMQFIDGRTAEDALERLGPGRDVREVCRWIRDAALAGHYAHEHGVIHRDLKPPNLMIDKEGRVYVMDFGLAKLNAAPKSGTISGMILGTPSYMPPEQASGHTQEIEARSDVYALGASLYVLLSGQKPFDGETVTDILIKIITTDPLPLRKIDPTIPWELEAIVEKAMARAKDRRYATARHMAEDLTRFLQNEPIRARGSTLTYRMIRRIGRLRSHLLTVALGAALVTAAILFLRRPGPDPAPSRGDADRLGRWVSTQADLRRALAIEIFERPAAAAVLERATREFPEHKEDVNVLVDAEHRNLLLFLETLPRDQWLRSRDRVRKMREWLEMAGRPVAPADRILAWRGTCILTVQVHPWATIHGAPVAHLPEEDRCTPLLLRDLEIGDGRLELRHPEFGSLDLPLKDLQDGRSYLLEGDWKDKDSIRVREGP